MMQFVDLHKCYVQTVSTFWMTLVYIIVTYFGFSTLQIA
jgi:cbb3-type cytochrome oxidase subunit 3